MSAEALTASQIAAAKQFGQQLLDAEQAQVDDVTPPRPGDISPDPEAEIRELWEAVDDQAARLDQVAATLAERSALPEFDHEGARRMSALSFSLEFSRASIGAGQSVSAADVVATAEAFALFLSGREG